MPCAVGLQYQRLLLLYHSYWTASTTGVAFDVLVTEMLSVAAKLLAEPTSFPTCLCDQWNFHRTARVVYCWLVKV